MISVQVNGAVREFDDELTVAQLVERLSLSGKKLAIERNGELVMRSEYGVSKIADGDQLEIVMAVGGG